MKTKTLLFILFLSICSTQSFSQASVTSTTGYTVSINVYAVAVKPASNSCTYGYVYSVDLRYSISMTGNNKPASLYTLQGTIGCTPGTSFFDLPNTAGSGTVTSVPNYNSASNCATVTPGILKCNTVTIEISGPGISARTVSFTASTTPLEIKLISFDAEPVNNKVKLNWSTASENNNDYFTIERSADGVNWNEVKKVDGAGNSNNVLTYESYDQSPLSGTSYYRLKQTDFDGTAAYSNIRTVTYKSGSKNISLYPVPNTGNTITITGITDYKNQELTVVNASGAVLYNTVLSKASVELPSLKPGLYIIRLKDKVSGETENLRYVKL